MSKPLKDRHVAEAYIKNGRIVIDLPVSYLAGAVSGACDLGAIDPPFKVTNSKLFAPEVCHALNREDEDGTTAIHRLFDQAFMDAVEDGAMGVKLQKRDEDGEVEDE